MTQGKTLDELNVKAGDVVKFVAGNVEIVHRIDTVIDGKYIGEMCEGGEYLIADDPVWSIVSRATPPTWGEMTRLEQGEILVDDQNGLDIEAFVHGDKWERKENGFPYFKNKSYRTKSEPVVEMVTILGGRRTAWNFSNCASSCGATHEFTFEIRDGEPVIGSEKMVKICQ